MVILLDIAFGSGMDDAKDWVDDWAEGALRARPCASRLPGFRAPGGGCPVWRVVAPCAGR